MAHPRHGRVGPSSPLMLSWPSVGRSQSQKYLRGSMINRAKEASRNDGIQFGKPQCSSDDRIALAQKLRMARELARKLAAEAQVLAKSASLANTHEPDHQVASLAKKEHLELRAQALIAAEEAAVLAADVSTTKPLSNIAGGVSTERMMAMQIHRLQEENSLLKSMVLDMAANQHEVSSRFVDLASALPSGNTQPRTRPSDAETDVLTMAEAAKRSEEEAGRAVAEAKAAAEMMDEIAQVVVGLEAAKKVVEGHSLKPGQISKLAQKSLENGNSFFCTPMAAVPVGKMGSRIYYNCSSGPCNPDASLVLKAGINGWESILEFQLSPSSDLQNVFGHIWFEAGISLPADTFKVQFVVMDEYGTVDNNAMHDYDLPLYEAPSEEDVLSSRLKKLEAAEAIRRKAEELEESKLFLNAMNDAELFADSAVISYAHDVELELRRAADKVACSRRKYLTNVKTKCHDSVANVFFWGSNPMDQGMTRLCYNMRRLSVSSLNDLILHLGYDGWYEEDVVEIFPVALSLKESRAVSKSGGDPSHWIAFEVEVPCHSGVLDFVFSNAEKTIWDNADGEDYHTIVLHGPSEKQLAEIILKNIRNSSAREAMEEECLVWEWELKKRIAKTISHRRRRERQRQTVFTDPCILQHGKEVCIYYKPKYTVLNDKPHIWARGSWNRSQHHQCWMPIKMEPIGPGILQAADKLKVPSDAYMLDIVFADSDDLHGGFTDDNGGLKYHVPIHHRNGLKKSLQVVHLSVEMAPVAKVGGMGDVVTALSRAVQDEGHCVKVLLPKHDIIDYSSLQLKSLGQFSWGNCTTRVFSGVVEDIEVIFLDPDNGYFQVGCIYGRSDDRERFDFFNGLAIEYLQQQGEKPDVVHCHDWPTAPGVYLNGPGKKVFTIHNLNYGADQIGRAMAECAMATTVSPTYAKEICGHPVIAPNNHKMYGIVNGIDYETWSPAKDLCLPMKYSCKNVKAGKLTARRELRSKLGLSHIDVPIIGVVTRLTHQKGIHLIKHAAWQSLEKGGQFVLLGSAPDPNVQKEFEALSKELAKKYPDRARLWFAFDEPLSRLIYAGADMVLVPSMFEPCGLTQLIAMSYGTVPIVRRTGGLNDTVFDVDYDKERAKAAGCKPNGFTFEGTDTQALDSALCRSLNMWHSNKPAWWNLSATIMAQDWSWNSPALDYIEVYYKAMET